MGCGAGNFTGFLLDRQLVVAVDPEPACLRQIAQRFHGRQNLTVELCGPPSTQFAALARFQPDTCICFNVLEHIREDGAAIAAMASIIPSGGILLLFAPAFEALYGPIDRALGHYRRYTRPSLLTLAQAAGLQTIDAQYVNLPGLFAWWLNARIFRRQTQSPAQIAFFDSLIVPVASRIEALIPPSAGLSVFAAFRKP